MKLAPLSLWFFVKQVPADIQKKQVAYYSSGSLLSDSALIGRTVHPNDAR